MTGTAGQPLTYAVSVTNYSPVTATDVVLTEEIPPTSNVPIPVSSTGPRPSVSASQGTVKPLANGGFVAELGNLASGATATLTIVVISLDSHRITSRLSVHANESDTNPGNDTATLIASISKGPASSPPHVLSVRSSRAKRKGLTAVVVGFDQPMDPGHLTKIGIYHLVILGKGKKAHPKVVGLSSAMYDATSRTVRLSLKKPVKTRTLRLTIDHSGIVAASGIGLAGGDYVATVPR